jgi:hypothetical protein
LNNQFQSVTWLNLSPKPRSIEPTKKRNPSRMGSTYQNGYGSHLRNRFTHQHSGQRWPTWEMSREEPLVSRETPKT